MPEIQTVDLGKGRAPEDSKGWNNTLALDTKGTSGSHTQAML